MRPGRNFCKPGVETLSMGRVIVHMALIAGCALVLTGCGFTDMRSPVPEFMRMKAAEPPPPEPPPDLKRLLSEKLDQVFTPASRPTAVRFSAPRPELRGTGWTACVRAELVSVTGKPLGTQTYRISIANNTIYDRQRVEAEDTCTSESYEPV